MIWFDLTETTIDIEDDYHKINISIPIVRFPAPENDYDHGACSKLGCPGHWLCSKDLRIFHNRDDVCTWMAEGTNNWDWYLDVPPECVPALFTTLDRLMSDSDVCIIKKTVFKRRRKDK